MMSLQLNQKTSFLWKSFAFTESTTCQIDMTNSTRDKSITQEKKLADDIDYILNDDVIGWYPLSNYRETIVNNIGFFFNYDIPVAESQGHY